LSDRYISTVPKTHLQSLIRPLGSLVEIGPADAVFFDPQHAFTQMLVGSNPEPDPEFERSREHVVLKAEIPSPVNVGAGCRFAGRCPKAMDRCRAETPQMIDIGRTQDPRRVACHLFN